jgi:hypothetical protein
MMSASEDLSVIPTAANEMVSNIFIINFFRRATMKDID